LVSDVGKGNLFGIGVARRQQSFVVTAKVARYFGTCRVLDGVSV